jgi:hypothetical protein
MQGAFGGKPVEAESITLELLQSYYNVPLAELAKELGLSLTLLKKICRKFGIQRWPHRQIRSLNKSAQELQERAYQATSAEEQADIKVQLDLLEKKKRLVTRGASSGLQSALRNALFLANPEQLQEHDAFSEDADMDVPVAAVSEKLVQTAKPAGGKKQAQKAAAAPEQTPLFKMMNSLKNAAAPSPAPVNNVMMAPSMLPASAAPEPRMAPFVMPPTTGFNSFSHMHQDNQAAVQQQMAQHMAQMALHQQMQMTSYSKPVPRPAAPIAAPVPTYAQPMAMDSMFDSTPFEELAELLGIHDEADAALAAMEMPGGDDFMSMMETCASGELMGFEAPQQLPFSMSSGGMQTQQQYYDYNSYNSMQTGWAV